MIQRAKTSAKTYIGGSSGNTVLGGFMHEELKFIGLAPLFGVFGALTTAGIWQVFALTALDLVPARQAVLACTVVGLAGPLALWIAVFMATRRRSIRSAFVLRRAASVGLGLVLAAELGFYVPLGLLAMAFN